MPRYACHHAIRLLTPSKIRTLDIHHHYHTTHLSTTHRIWDPEYPTFLSITHTEEECSDSGSSLHAHCIEDDDISIDEKERWRVKLVGKKLVSRNSSRIVEGSDEKTFNVQDLPAGQDSKGPTCTRILGPLKGIFHDIVESRLTIRVDENDVVWDVYFG
ncbi:hypothetical protein TWF281_000229 [Arthrobotrys megalospora]